MTIGVALWVLRLQPVPTEVAPAVEDRGDPMLATTIAEFRRSFSVFDDDAHAFTAGNSSGNWARAEIGRHQRVLEGRRFDMIVLPLQETRWSNDRVARLMASRWVTHEIEQQAGCACMSPELALRLMGGRATRFEDDVVFTLAKRVNARIVHLYLDTNGATLRVGAATTDADGNIATRAIVRIEQPSDERPLDAMIAAVARDLVATLFQSNESPAQTLPRAALDNDWYWPTTLAQLVERADSPLDHAVTLQFFALLTPYKLLYERRRLLERSLIALSDVHPESDHYDLVRARALFHLYRRPAASARLMRPATVEERALRHYIDGNYPELRELTAEIKHPLLKALSAIELLRLSRAYGKEDVLPPIFSGKQENWNALFETVTRSNEPWFTPSNVSMFLEMGGLLPEFDGVLARVIREQAVTGDLRLSGAGVGLVEQALTLAPDKAIAADYGGRLQTADVWRLFQNLAFNNLLRWLSLELYNRADFDRAFELAKALEPYYGDHPALLSRLAYGSEAVAKKETGEQSEYWRRKAAEYGLRTEINSAGLDGDTIHGYEVRSRALNGPPSLLKEYSAPFTSVMWQEFPSSMWVTERYPGGAFAAPPAAALPYTHTGFRLLTMAIEHGGISDAEAAEALATRFNGHPKKQAFAVDSLIEKGLAESAIGLLREQIDGGDRRWRTYSKLGWLLIQEGRYREAQATYLDHPDFQAAVPKKPIVISNRAFDLGELFYWRGRYPEARPFFDIGAAQSTGAAAEHLSRQRLATLDGDHATAMSEAYIVARRYNDEVAYADYLKYLHVLGYHKEATAGFRRLAPRYELDTMWVAPFIGQRIQGLSPEAIRDWAQEVSREATKFKLGRGRLSMFQDYAQQLLMWHAIIDHPTPSSWLPLVRSMRRERKPPQPMATLLVRLFADGEPDSTSNITNPNAHFLQAYVAWRDERYSEAYEQLLRYDSQFALETVNASFALPYFAMSASRTAAADKLADLMPTLKKKVDFDYELTKAVVFASLGDIDASLLALDKTLNLKPGGGIGRPVFASYQIVETAEWLYQLTGEKGFLERALDWAKRRQVIYPTQAWSHAFEAAYGSDRDRRVRAAGFASYLDPGSRWLQQTPEDIRDAGVEWWRENKHFAIAGEPPGI